MKGQFFIKVIKICEAIPGRVFYLQKIPMKAPKILNRLILYTNGGLSICIAQRKYLFN